MIKKNESNEWLAQIDNILNSDAIQNNKSLFAIFMTAKKAIEKGEQDVLAKLSSDISWYLILNKYEAPKPVIDFAQSIAKKPHQSRGKLALLQMLALSLIPR